MISSAKVGTAQNSSEPEKFHPIVGIYTDRLHEYQSQLATVQSRRLRILIVIIGTLGVFTVLLILSLTHAAFPAALSVVTGFGALLLYLRYVRMGERWKELSQQCDYFERGIARLTNNWQDSGDTGLDFARDNHLYQSDLNVLGSGSLFELLCTTRSKAGAERLACYLLDPVELAEVRLRQEAVKELRNATALREEINRLGKYRLQDCSGNSYKEWLALPKLTFHRMVPVFLLVSSSISLLLGIGIFAKILLWTQWGPLLGLLIVMQTGIAGILLRKTRPQIEKLRLLSDAFALLQQGLGLMQRQRFHSPKLGELVERVSTRNASLQIKKVERLILAFDQREKPQFLYLSMLLAIGTQLVIAVDRWRSRYQEDFDGWLDAWAEFEALNAIAGYAFEQAGCIFPELAQGDPVFASRQLEHPLLSTGICVGNDVILDRQSRFYLVSGSNMAGKSTFLRAIGLNTVIALAGGPVRATSARLSCFTLCASLAITDSLTNGRSKFMSEVERIKNMIGCTHMAKPVLFLIDEILSGTNSQDRSVASEAVIKTLLAGGAVGALSTHDLALAEIAYDTSLGGVLVCMESSHADNPLGFDYRIKPGISRQSSALAIVRMMGISTVHSGIRSGEITSKGQTTG